MDIKKIEDIINLLKETDISEIEVTDEDGTLRLCRNSASPQQAAPVMAAPMHYMSTPPTGVPVSSGPGPTAPLAPTEASGPAKEPTKGHVVRSPMVGTLYTSPAPEAPVFVSIGQTVKVGDTLCIIEAMKMFNEIESDRAGKIIEILASNGDPIEFDQALFVIE